MTDGLIPLLEAARRLGLKRSKAYRSAKRGEFPVPVEYIGVSPMVREADVECFLHGEPAPEADEPAEQTEPVRFIPPVPDQAATLLAFETNLKQIIALCEWQLAQVQYELRITFTVAAEMPLPSLVQRRDEHGTAKH